MGKLALSVATIAILAVAAISIKNKHDEIANTNKQVETALQYETKQKTLQSDSYERLNVKPELLFITKTQRDKDLMTKLRKAVEEEVIKNPAEENFSCSTLASTGKITLKECKYLQKKQFNVILPTNLAVEQSTANDIKANALNNDKNNSSLQKQIIVSKVANTIAPVKNSVVSRQYMKDIEHNKSVISVSNDMLEADRHIKREKKESHMVKEAVKTFNPLIQQSVISSLDDVNKSSIKKPKAKNYYERLKERLTSNIVIDNNNSIAESEDNSTSSSFIQNFHRQLIQRMRMKKIEDEKNRGDFLPGQFFPSFIR